VAVEEIEGVEDAADVAAEDNTSREAAADTSREAAADTSREDTNSRAKEDTNNTVLSSNSRAREEASTVDNHLEGSPPTQSNDTTTTGTVGPMDAT
jgi:hypothetical protein